MDLRKQQQYIDPIEIKEDLQYLDRAVTKDYDSAELIRLLHSMVPTYRTPEEVNHEAEETRGELETV